MKLPKKSKDFYQNKKQGKTCLLMYSGGVDTSLCVYLLQKYYGYKVITLTVDVCQDTGFAREMAEKAKKLGAVKALIYDGKAEFADHYLSQIIKANGFYDDFYPIGTSIARPWQAKIGIDLAKEEKAAAIAHGNKGRGAGAFQFNMVMNFFMPEGMKLETPIGDWWPERSEEIEFALKNNIPIPVDRENPFSYDDNIMSNAINYGEIDDIEKPVPESAYKWTEPIEKTPDKPEFIELEFIKGLPVRFNNQAIDLADLFLKLNQIGGSHGIGRIDMIENGLYGNKFKWVYEAPAAQIIIFAHKEIEKLVLPKATLSFKHNLVDKKWAELVYHAQVYSPLARALMSFIENTQQYINGNICLKLFKGTYSVMKRSANNSLVNLDSKNLHFSLPAGQAGLPLDEIPYGFEEYSFGLKHNQVFADHLFRFREKKVRQI